VAGQRWRVVIKSAIEDSHVVLVCLSRKSIVRQGFYHKEIRYALEVADEQPEGAIYLIPTRLEECDIPQNLEELHYVELFKDSGYAKLLNALTIRANDVGVRVPKEHTS
jgi:hypothetical protein